MKINQLEGCKFNVHDTNLFYLKNNCPFFIAFLSFLQSFIVFEKFLYIFFSFKNQISK